MVAVVGALVLWMTFLTLSPVCPGQSALYPSAGGNLATLPGGSGPPGQSHGWIAVPSMSGAVLVHLPPRRPGLNDGAPDGTMRQARELKVMPEALAGIGERVYLMSDVAAVDDVPARRCVESFRALPSAVGDRWFFEPEARAREHPDLPAGGPVRGFVGTVAGPLVLVDGQLWLLDDRGWNEIDPPSPLVGRAWDGTERLLSIDGRPAVLCAGPKGSVEVWTGEIGTPRMEWPVSRAKRRDRPARDRGESKEPRPEPGADGEASSSSPYDVLWSVEVYASDGSLAGARLASPWIGSVAGVLVYVGGREDGSVVVGTMTRQSSYELATVHGVGGVFGVVPAEDAARVVLAWLEKEPMGPDAVSGARVRGHLEVREISVFTGAVLYAGEQRGDGPVSALEVQLLAGVLVLVMIVVLVLVLTREPDNGTFHLPRGATLAEPGRRALAGVIDLAGATLIADKVWGVPVSDLLGPNRIFSGEAIWVLGTAILIGLVLGTIGEWLTGRSLGKAIMGCAVVDARDPGGEPVAPKFWQALVRNLVKWIAAPAAMLGLMQPSGRHRGDALSRTLVCVGADDDQDGSGGSDERDRP